MVRSFRHKLTEVYSIAKETDMFCLTGGLWWSVGPGISDGVGWGQSSTSHQLRRGGGRGQRSEEALRYFIRNKTRLVWTGLKGRLFKSVKYGCDTEAKRVFFLLSILFYFVVRAFYRCAVTVCWWDWELQNLCWNFPTSVEMLLMQVWF